MTPQDIAVLLAVFVLMLAFGFFWWREHLLYQRWIKESEADGKAIEDILREFDLDDMD